MSQVTAGVRITLRGEDFLVTDTKKGDIIEAEGISELVKGMKFSFDLKLEKFELVSPENTQLIPDTSPNYRQTKLFIETTLRNSSFYSDAIEVANKAAIRAANYQFVPTLKAFSLPRPRTLIADAVGLGKTIQVGIFLAELMRRGKGQRLLVVTPKSILAQFQQEIWARFAIPLVRLDSQGIAKIKAEIPANKNPFDYYDKVIVSIDTLKNNAKFQHYLEKTHWDAIVIDECHTVANASSQRGGLAKFLSPRCEAMVLTSATPHNGKKENFANLMTLLEPTAIPYRGDFTREDIAPYYVRRFKKDIENEVGDAFRDRITEKITCELFDEEEQLLALQQEFKKRSYDESGGDLNSGSLLFSIGLFKAYMSSPEACLATVNNRIDKEADTEDVTLLLHELRQQLEGIIAKGADAKYKALKQKLFSLNWTGSSRDERVIIFAERRDTMSALQRKLTKDFNLSEKAVAMFHGGLSDTEQQNLIEDFSKEDSDIRLFITSDAGSQGVNLHYHCNRMFNYDIPWSIITLEQRNGRIDRFGQKHTPFIYYLIARSGNQKVQGDIRILEKLKEKEEEVYKALGDAGSVLKLFDAEKEQKLVEKAMATSDETLLDKEVKDEEVDWEDVFGLGDKAEEEKVPAQVKYDTGFKSFYPDDFAYYLSLVEEIKYQEPQMAQRFSVEAAEQLLEVTEDKELSRHGVLYDIPTEAFPAKNGTFKLTTNKVLVEQAIERARKKKGEWPDHQLLYDLHPIARWLQFKLLGKVDKGKALIARMRQPLPQDTAWFVFQGISSNGQGQPVLSKVFAVGMRLDGTSLGKIMEYTDFVNTFRLTDELYTLEVSQDHLATLQEMLPDAVEDAKYLYMFDQQARLQADKEGQLREYEQKLASWASIAKNQLEIQFGTDEQGVLAYNKDKRLREVETILGKSSKFYKDLLSLENEPFLRLLAVYFNN